MTPELRKRVVEFIRAVAPTCPNSRYHMAHDLIAEIEADAEPDDTPDSQIGGVLPTEAERLDKMFRLLPPGTQTGPNEKGWPEEDAT